MVYENEFRFAILAVWYRIIAELTLARFLSDVYPSGCKGAGMHIELGRHCS
jgi:hypothetical protein